MMTAPTYGKWCDRKLWTVHEAICLLLAIEPETPWLRNSHSVGGANPLIEALDMREAQRAYEANLNVIETARSMQARTLDLLKR